MIEDTWLDFLYPLLSGIISHDFGMNKVGTINDYRLGYPAINAQGKEYDRDYSIPYVSAHTLLDKPIYLYYGGIERYIQPNGKFVISIPHMSIIWPDEHHIIERGFDESVGRPPDKYALFVRQNNSTSGVFGVYHVKDTYRDDDAPCRISFSNLNAVLHQDGTARVTSCYMGAKWCANIHGSAISNIPPVIPIGRSERPMFSGMENIELLYEQGELMNINTRRLTERWLPKLKDDIDTETNIYGNTYFNDSLSLMARIATASG